MNPDDAFADLLEAAARQGLLDASRIEAAFRLASQAHATQQRNDGSPYVVHPVRVATIVLNEWKQADPDLAIAALLHDVVEDTEVTLEQVKEAFGERVADLVDHLTKAPVPAGKTKADRDEVYYGRLLEGPPGAALVKAADRVDNLRDVLGARWPQEKKRSYADDALSKILPIVQKHAPEQAGPLEETARDILTRLDAGEGDVPDVGPNDDVTPMTGDEDPIIVASRHLSFFRKGQDVYLYHDLIGDIIMMHEKVLGFLDYFRTPRRESEARTAFADQFEQPDLNAFFETLSKHLVLLLQGIEDTEIVGGWFPLRGPWILSHRPEGGRLTLCYKDRREAEVVVESLPPVLGRLFRLCDGSNTIDQIIRRLGKEFPKEKDLDKKVRLTIQRWTHSQRQLLKLLPRPLSAYEMIGLPPYASSTMPYPLLRSSDEPPPEPVYGTRDYHKLEIESADEQFDLRETTLSHAFRVPHVALNGRTYGTSLAAALVGRDVVPNSADAPFRMVEVGGGTGFFAKSFLDGIALQAPRVFNRIRYTIVDLSPALRASQVERTSVHKDKLRITGGDAEALPIKDASVEFLIANEMIADLPVRAVRRADAEGDSDESGGDGAEIVRKYGIPIDDAPGLFFLNLGAIHLIEECARVLKPGGTAVLTEFGSHSKYPEESTHLDHSEFSIHFGHLKHVAEQLGFETSLEYLPALLGLDESVKVLQTTQSFFETLRAYLDSRGIRLEKIAYTEESFAELLGDALKAEDLEGVKFDYCGNRVLGLKPNEFKALLLRKPRESGRKVKKAVLDI